MEAIGFDSPEVQAQIVAAFEQVRDAFVQVAEACRVAWQVIADAIAPIIRAVVRWYREARRLHLIPRQYRDTMAKRKLRRCVALMARRN